MTAMSVFGCSRVSARAAESSGPKPDLYIEPTISVGACNAPQRWAVSSCGPKNSTFGVARTRSGATVGSSWV
jgi:hypothetical protein